ncbi:phage/plasmid primase, P4 family [Nitrosospira sp. Is2]|uniref:phage/plasmid primase, P4 family n=1 Tax=Nitrosospira sp. Is2 TaxID=3080532 RepID=UPI002954D76C|nr:phage/plasmid primase, P4 family [Nitrosospira sp. Is2]WON74164.1 phage/plasmid primase, P4 family [Nitrosospira sp. Is2]
MSRTDIGRAINALMAIPSDLPYPEWFKAGCGAIAAGLSIDDIDAWSSTGSNYKGRPDVEKTFRNITPEGGITRATLIHMAQQYDYTVVGNRRSSPHPRTPKKPRFTRPIPSSSEILAEVVENCEPASAAQPYIEKKKGLPGLFVYKGTKTIHGYDCNGALVLLLSDLDRNVVGAQFIPLEGKKVYPLGTKLPAEACLVIGGELREGGTAYIVEGIGQAWTVHQATGALAVVCFGKGRMAGVAKAIHARYPNLRLIIVPDGNGQTEAAKIALAVGGVFVEVPSGWPANYDINDFHKETGSLKAVESMLKSAKAPGVADQNTIGLERGNTLNDSGNAARLVTQFGHDIRWLPHIRKWMIRNGQYWEINEDGAIERFATATAASIYEEARKERDADKARNIGKWAGSSLSQPRLKAMIELAKSELNMSVPMSALDQNGMLLGTPSGVVDLKTGKLCEATPLDYITKITGAPYVPGATCPNWKKFIDRSFSGNQAVIKLVQRAVGYSLTGTTIEQLMFFIYGGGCNGKSVFLETLRVVFGSYAMQAQAEMLMQSKGERASNDIARLRGARMVSAIEIEDGCRLSEALVKQLTGGDQIAARFLFGEYFEYKPAFKIWLAANHKPIIRGDDRAIWRRICLIPFLVTIPEQELDKQLSSKLAAEAPGILQWAIEGCLEWQGIELSLPPEIIEAVDQYRSDMNVFHRWLDERCEKGPGKSIGAEAAFKSQCEWAEQNGFTALTNRKFADKLLEHGFAKKRGNVGYKYLGLTLLRKS